MLEEYIQKGIVEEKTLLDLLREGNEQVPQKTALIDPYRRVRYAELMHEALQCAAVFQENGLVEGDHMLLLMNNRIEFFSCLFGMMFLGVRPVLMLPSHRRKEIETIFEFSDAKGIVTYGNELGFDYVQTALEVTAEHGRVFAYEKREGVNYLPELLGHASEPILAEVKGQDIALFLLSGGTTGIPKMIPKRHSAYVYNAIYSAKRCVTDETSVYLAALSVAHDYPLSCPGVLGTMARKGTSVLSMTASFDEVAMHIAQEHVTFTQIAPSLAAMWLECMEWEEDVDVSTLQYIEIGAAKLEWDLAERLENAFGAKIIQGYGLGEGITCFTSIDDTREVAWTCQGKPISEYDEIKIVDEIGKEVPQGEAGELIEKGPYTFEGYYHAEELNRQLFSEDGFFHTGDKAILTDEGNIRVIGRVREQINRAGENVIPSEVEAYLKGCEEISDAAVFGIADAELGEKVCAVLIAKGEELTLLQVCEKLSEAGMAAYKLPDVIYYVDHFPLINVGKVDKKKLKQDLNIIGER